MNVNFHKRFLKQYKKLRAIQKKINERLFLFQHNPYHSLLGTHALSGKYKGYRSIDITGDVRALYEPIGKDAAFFITVDTHSNLYQ